MSSPGNLFSITRILSFAYLILYQKFATILNNCLAFCFQSSSPSIHNNFKFIYCMINKLNIWIVFETARVGMFWSIISNKISSVAIFSVFVELLTVWMFDVDLVDRKDNLCIYQTRINSPHFKVVIEDTVWNVKEVSQPVWTLNLLYYRNASKIVGNIILHEAVSERQLHNYYIGTANASCNRRMLNWNISVSLFIRINE